MDHGKSQHIVAMYVLIVLLALALAFTAFRMSSAGVGSEGSWECSRVACEKYIDPGAWVAANCAPAADGEDRTCTVNIDGAMTPVPLSLINLTYVAQQCESVACMQEVYTRDANYTIENLTQP